jgi:TetR/AcrR family transcriptional regulator, transcriptional repressor for nem operon
MDTRTTLIDKAIGIVRKTGYAGFSYADLSDAVGIRKASIHHHFPSKGDLGVAMVESYRGTFGRQLANIVSSETKCAKRLRLYADLYRAGAKDGKGCLCGVLAAELADLPVPVQSAVRAFFDDNVAWLETVIAEGRASREIERTKISARQLAQMILATLQGAMLMARAQEDVAAFNTAASTVIAIARG